MIEEKAYNEISLWIKYKYVLAHVENIVQQKHKLGITHTHHNTQYNIFFSCSILSPNPVSIYITNLFFFILINHAYKEKHREWSIL